MVELDRVEMIRANVGGVDLASAGLSKQEEEEEEENTVPLDIQKQKQSSAVKDKLLALRNEEQEDPAESREDIPAVCENRYGMRDNEEEIIIEAEFETVLEEDAILMALDTAIDEGEVEGEGEEKSDPILMTTTETELEELGGIEVEYGTSNSFTTSSDDDDEEQIDDEELETKQQPTSFDCSKNPDTIQVDPEPTLEEENDINSEAGSSSESKSIGNGTVEKSEIDLDENSKEENNVTDKTDDDECETIQSHQEDISMESDSKIMSEVASVETTTIKGDDDETKQEPDNNDHPSLPIADATWSFDTTSKRKKGMKTKSRVVNNAFPGFEEEDGKDIVLDATWNKTKIEKRNVITGFDEVDEKDTTLFCISSDKNGVASDAERDENIFPTKDERIEKDVSVAGLSDEDVEGFDDDRQVSSSQSIEFDAILESVAEYIETKDWDAFIAAVTSRPSLATLSPADFFASEFSGFLAEGANESVLLHEVCRSEPSVEAVKTLIEVHEAAVKTAGQWGYLPIHCACASGASEAVVNVLVDANPESIQHLGDDKMFPLHLACKKGTSKGTIKLLIAAYPPACIAKDVYNNTPMDYISSFPEGSEKQTMLELLGRQIQSMCISTSAIEEKLEQSEEEAASMKIELSGKHRKVTALERELKELYGKSLSVEEELKEKQGRTVALGKKLKENQEKIVLLERELGEESAKASVFGENLKAEFTKSCLLEGELREERARSFALEIELKTNCDEWNTLGKEMEEEFKKSSLELKKERNHIAVLERKLSTERDKSSIFEGQLINQYDKSSCLDVTLNGEREKLSTIQEKLLDSKHRWMMEKQELHEKNASCLAEAYHIVNESEETTRLQKERWLVERQEIYRKNDIQMTETYELVDETEGKLNGKHAKGLMERQELYNKSERQLVEAYNIICETEANSEEERTKWLFERQNTYEKNDKTLVEAFKIVYDTEMELKSKQSQLHDYEMMLEERQKLIEQERQKSRTLLRQLELAKTTSTDKLKGIGDELYIQKSFSSSQARQIEVLESSIEQKLAAEGEIAEEQQHRLAHEKSLTDEIMTRIKEKKRLIKDNEAVVHVLEKSNAMKQELLESQQRKVEALEVGRREKEKQLKLNQEATIQLENSIAKKLILEKEEVTKASRLAGTRASRKAAIDIEEDQIKELDYTLARKQALIELESMKEKTLQQTIVQKHELIDSEMTRIKELELLIAEKQMLLTSERNTIQTLKATKAEKDAILASEKDVVYELRKTQEEKEKILEAKKKTEDLLQSRIIENEILLASKKAAIKEVKAAQAKINSELEIQKVATVKVERQIARKKSLITREEYIAKCLQQLALRKRESMPSGAASYFANATFGMKFLLKETFLVSSYVKTQIREQSAFVRQRKGDVLARVIPGADACKSLVLYGPRVLLKSSFVRNFVVNSSRIPKWSKESKK